MSGPQGPLSMRQLGAEETMEHAKNCGCHLCWEPPIRLKKDREWRDYPLGTKAHAHNGGAWLKTERGWTWNGHTRCPGSTFPTPGADAFGVCIELPTNVE